MYDYIENYLSKRSICTRVNNTYSDFRSTNIGIPQGSIIAPLLFSILLHDLPSVIQKDFNLVQYADDICIWLNTHLRKKTKKSSIKYIEKLFQQQIDALALYMKINGFELSKEKTHLMLFNNGMNPSYKPKITINGAILEYKTETKFLGVIFTPKLNWKNHIEYLLNKARQRLSLLKVISSLPWGQHTQTLIHLAISLIRSKLIYGQEVYFSSPKYLLKRLQSVDSKALKIALGVPFHANTLKCYNETKILPLDKQRELAVSKYVVRSLSVENSNHDEVQMDCDTNYPKVSRNISYLQTIHDFTHQAMEECDINTKDIPILPHQPIIPPWEHLNAVFDTNYSNWTKSDNENIVALDAKEILSQKYQYHLQIFTDGSVTSSGESGFGFYIPALNVNKSFHIGKGKGIFTSELYAILMSLNYVYDTNYDIYKLAVCVDSKSVLQTIENWNFCSSRSDLVFEIRFLVHILSIKGIEVSFVWIPSHVGIRGNERADLLAKKGALNDNDGNAISLSIKNSGHELCTKLNQHFKKSLSKEKEKHFMPNCSERSITKIIYRLRLNAWATKYTKDIRCICEQHDFISVEHILLQCPKMNQLYKEQGIDIQTYSNKNIELLLYDEIMIEYAKVIKKSPLGRFI